MAVLIDSSIWIDWLRKRIDPRPLIRPWLMHRACFTCGVIRVEVLRGIVNRRQMEKVEQLLDAMEHVPLSADLWKLASQQAWELDRKGKLLSVSDLIIAECAKKHDAWLVTLDEDFKIIPGLRVRHALPSLDIA